MTVASCSSTASCAFKGLSLSPWGEGGPGRTSAPLRWVPAGIPPHPARLQHLAANGYCSDAGRNVSWAVLEKKTRLELLTLHVRVIDYWWCRSDCPWLRVFFTSCVCWQLPKKVGKRVMLALLIDKVWLNHEISEVPVGCVLLRACLGCNSSWFPSGS